MSGLVASIPIIIVLISTDKYFIKVLFAPNLLRIKGINANKIPEIEKIIRVGSLMLKTLRQFNVINNGKIIRQDKTNILVEIILT
jgi:hypothetical protein